VMTAARALWQQHGGVHCWLLECTGFPWLRPFLKTEFERPVFDWLTLCNQLMDSSVARPALFLP
jgi:hypothetical protein